MHASLFRSARFRFALPAAPWGQRLMLGGALLALGVALLFGWLMGRAGEPAPLPAAAPARAADIAPPPPAAAPAAVLPQVDARTREERRFMRADRDDDGRITRDEYLANRRRTYERLDKDGNGALSFEEYASKGTDKFVATDADKDGALSAKEFATTAPKPRARREACDCSAASNAD